MPENQARFSQLSSEKHHIYFYYTMFALNFNTIPKDRTLGFPTGSHKKTFRQTITQSEVLPYDCNKDGDIPKTPNGKKGIG